MLNKHIDRITVLKYTDDDWFGNDRVMHNGQWTRVVEVSLMRLRGDTEWRVCVWGNDDMGLEKDFSNPEEATSHFLMTICWPRVNKQLLKDAGFYPA
jgi:hypothetical protein